MFTERRTSSIITFIFLLLMLGFIQFATVGFNPSIYTVASFWITLTYRMGLKFLCDKVGNDFMYDRNYNLKENVRTRRIYANANRRRGNDFDRFLADANKKTKTFFYEEVLTKKKNKLIRKSARINNPKKKQRIDDKLKLLNNKDYNIDEINVKYPQLFHSHFLIEEGSNKKTEYKYQSNYGLATLKASLKNLSTYLLISVLIGSIVYEFTTPNDVSFLINMGYNGMIVVLALSNAIFKSKSIYNSEFKASLENKIRVLINYFEWSDIVTFNFDEETKKIDEKLAIEFDEKKKLKEKDKVVNPYG